MKKCSKCRTEKALSEFNKGKLAGGVRADCRVCQAAYNTTYRTENEEILRQRKKKHYAENAFALGQRQKAYREKLGAECIRLRKLKTTYGLTQVALRDLEKTQKGCCAICGNAFLNTKHTHIDHVHGSNPIRIRGILCGSCNIGLGNFKDSPERLLKAAAYLKKFQKSS